MFSKNKQLIWDCHFLFVYIREKIGYYESVNIINPEDAAILFKAEGHYPKRLKVEAWTSYRDYRNRKYGVLLKYVLFKLYNFCFTNILILFCNEGFY